MSGQTTRAAEQALGSQLSQDNMLQALSLYGQARQGLSYNDNRRFNSGISAKDRRAIRQDTYDVVSQLMKGVMK